MKNILCYGDSNTWGFIPGTGKRFPPDIRWTGVLAGELGDDFKIIEEGLNGRTTVWDDPLGNYKNGLKYFLPCLESHKPLDLVIIMLGTNDLKTRFSLNIGDIAKGAAMLAKEALSLDSEYGEISPKVLLVSPLHVKISPVAEIDLMYGGQFSVDRSRSFEHYFRCVTAELGCEFFDAARSASPSSIDGIHMDKQGHRNLGKAISKKVKEILL